MDYSSNTYQQSTGTPLAMWISFAVYGEVRYVAPATLMKNTI